MAEVNWALQAWDELAEVNDQLAKYSEHYADFVVDRIIEVVSLFKDFPRLGRVVPEINIQAIREVLVEKYRIVYIIMPNGNIEVLTVRHSSRPLPDTILPWQ